MQLFYLLDEEARGYVTVGHAREELPMLGASSAADIKHLETRDSDERLDRIAFFEWYTRCTPSLAASTREAYPGLFAAH